MLGFHGALIDDEAEQRRFGDIYATYHRQMLAVAFRVLHNPQDAEDAVQTALLSIAQHMGSVPKGDPARVRSYVLIAAKNAALSMLPKKQQRDSMADIEDLDLPGNDDLFYQLTLSQDYNLLLRAIRQLPELYREVLLLICVQELPVRDAAAILHRKPGTVRQQLARGKRLLVELCKKEGMHFEES